jgi:2-methylisocitrate lyase-like PEP mutase family enzyme
MDTPIAGSDRVRTFRRLHEDGCFVMPNPWDPGSAVVLEQLGFPAVATTSAGYAFSRARPDDAGGVTADEMLAHVADIVAATRLPVNADLQAGYADEPTGVAATVARGAATGAAGLSIEDATGDPTAPLYDRILAVERIAAARATLDAGGTGVVLTARCEAWLVGDPEPASTAIDRLVAYADAGADCLYAPGVTDPATIAAIVGAVAPRPVNVLVSLPSADLSVDRLADLGVRRVSVGSALALTAWGAFLRAAGELATSGTFEGFHGAATFAELNGRFRS